MIRRQIFDIKNLLYLAIIAIAATLLFFMIQDNGLNQKTIAVGNTEIAVEIADSFTEQAQGLSDRDSLCPECGMLFVYKEAKKRNFWMKDMKFSIDIIYIRNHEIVEIHENVPAPKLGNDPVRVPSNEPADMVLEVNGGFANRHQFILGASVDFLN